jgi:Concanavalin A-like lectin/glucanases superfamily
MSLSPPLRSATLLLVCLGACGPAPIEAVAISGRSLARGLVAHWAFDEQSGTTVADQSGNGHDGQLTGGSWVAAGRFGGGLRLQPGDSVTIPGFPHATPDWTASVWIKLSAADRAALTTDRAVLLTAERGAMGGWEIEFDPRPGFDWLEASYYVAPPTNDYIVLDCKCIEIDRWMHWTAVFDSTNHRFSLYRDGLLADSSSMPAPILPGEPDLDIGRWYQGDRSISGVIDDYAIWSRALSGDDVAAIHARAVPDSL